MPNLAPSASDAIQSLTSISPAGLLPETGFHRGIVLIESDVSLLSAETLLLTESGYRVTAASSNSEIVTLRNTKAVALAVIGDTLGVRLLRAVAEIVRRQWPQARILILGRASVLEDNLYDEQIERSADPKQLVVNLEQLYKDSWTSVQAQSSGMGAAPAHAQLTYRYSKPTYQSSESRVTENQNPAYPSSAALL